MWLVDLGLAQKARPALVLNRAFKDTDRALISVIPQGAFLVQNPVTVPVVKAERFLGKLNAQQLAAVETDVRDWLAL